MSDFRYALATVVLGVMILGASIVGCGSPTPPPTGIVTSKEFTPAHIDMVMMPMVTPGPNGTCTTTVVPMYFSEPDRWMLTVEPYDAAGNPLPVRRVLVTQTVYEGTSKGSWFEGTPEKIDTRQAKKERK